MLILVFQGGGLFSFGWAFPCDVFSRWRVLTSGCDSSGRRAHMLTIVARFAIENAFRFEDFTNDELREIMNLKLKSQDLQATDEAKTVAIEVLSRARNRPNFGNAGEVENQLGLAKDRHQRRMSTKPLSERSSDIIFEPEDFDPDYNRGAQASANMDKLFEGIIGCEDVVTKLRGYQQVAQGMKAQGLDPRGEIPTTFLFKGPPGTLVLLFKLLKDILTGPSRYWKDHHSQ